MTLQEPNRTSEWDNSSSDAFYTYYAQQSISPEAIERGERARDMLLRIRHQESRGTDKLEVLDVGCNAGTFSFPWALKSHSVVGVDVNEALIDLARDRSKDADLDVQFHVGSATDLPCKDSSFDVCMSPELLEHVEDWQTCLNEYTRVLRPGGILYLTTTNWLCPKQQEFTLPGYSWYPGPIKRFCEKLAVSSHPQIVNHATYPAVNWFSYYQLRRELAKRGFKSMSRFDVFDFENASSIEKRLVKLAQRYRVIGFIAQVLTPSTILVATKS